MRLLRRTVLALSALLAAAPPAARAQPGEAPPPGPLPDSRTEHDVRRYRERLGLSPDQIEALRAILAESRRKQDEIRRDMDEKIKNLLPPDQRSKFDERGPGESRGGREGGGEGRGGREGGPEGRGGPGHGGGFVGLSTDDLQRELGLTAEQREKIAAVLEQSRETVRSRMDRMRTEGLKGADWQQIRADFERQFKDTTEKIKAVLEPEQQKKLTEFLERGRAAIARPGGPWSPPASPDDRAARALDALKIGDAQQAAAVKDLLVRVTKLQADLAQADRAARDKARETLRAEGASDETAARQIEEIRAGRRAIEEQIRRAQDELRQGRSPRQELELIHQGFLN
jgi:Spy/CpxP family protein refolding chaperone